MDEARRIARKAAHMQLIADQYRQCASHGTAEERSLEDRVIALDRVAASLLSRMLVA